MKPLSMAWVIALATPARSLALMTPATQSIANACLRPPRLSPAPRAR